MAASDKAFETWSLQSISSCSQPQPTTSRANRQIMSSLFMEIELCFEKCFIAKTREKLIVMNILICFHSFEIVPHCKKKIYRRFY